MSRPATADAAPVCCACQSLMTNPWNPSSPLRSSLRSFEFWQEYELLSCWYEHMTDPTPARTASTNGQRYSSCIVLSSMLEERVSDILNPYPRASPVCRKCSISSVVVNWFERSPYLAR